MNAEGVFPHLVRLIKGGTDDDVGLHRHLMELLYAMSRIQRLSWSRLSKLCLIAVVFPGVLTCSSVGRRRLHSFPVLRPRAPRI